MNKMYQLCRRLPVACWAFIVILSTCEDSGQTVYDFSTNPGVDRFAFGVSILTSQRPPSTNDIPPTEVSAADNAPLCVSPDSRRSTGIFGNQVNAAVRFAFTFAEQPANINQIALLRRGNSG